MKQVVTLDRSCLDKTTTITTNKLPTRLPNRIAISKSEYKIFSSVLENPHCKNIVKFFETLEEEFIVVNDDIS